jgi:hypothetical protein
MRFEKVALATCTRPQITGRTSYIHVPRHPSGSLFRARAAFRQRRQVGWKSPDDPTATAKQVVVDRGTNFIQRKTNPTTSRDHLPSHRQFKLRVGSGAKQPQGSKGILERVRRGTIHHVERTKSHQIGGSNVPTTTSRHECPAARG